MHSTSCLTVCATMPLSLSARRAAFTLALTSCVQTPASQKGSEWQAPYEGGLAEVEVAHSPLSCQQSVLPAHLASTTAALTATLSLTRQ